MAAGRTRHAAVLLGLVAFAAAVIWFGIMGRDRTADVGAGKPEASGAPLLTGPGRGSETAAPGGDPAAEPQRDAMRTEAGRAPPNMPAPNMPATAPSPPDKPGPAREGAVAPSFDVVRVEPNGESVIAGRAAPGATVEMLRNGAMHARVASDPSGLFAFVPQALPPGTNEIVLQSIAPDGTRMQSRESITVAIAEKRDAKPLVTLTAPDKPTVVLSSPDEQAAPADSPRVADAREVAALPNPAAAAPAGPPAPGAAPATAPPGPSSQLPSAGAPATAPAAGQAAPPSAAVVQPAPPAPKPRPQVRIASVEAEEGGRMFVAGRAAPGATVRLYLNETLVAPGGAGADGRISFAIGRGVRPGIYRVRLDDVDPVSGEVKSRAEVEFNVPAPLLVELPPAIQPYVTTPPTADGASASAEAGSSGSRREDVSRPGNAPEPSGRSPAGPSGLRIGSLESPPRARAADPAASPPLDPSSSPRPDPGLAPGGAPSGTRTAATGASAPSTREAPLRGLDSSTILVPEINTAIVSRGDNLWRISRRIYGRGVRYSVIYSANQQQIRNPRLIYPGQVFVLPTDSAENAAR